MWRTCFSHHAPVTRRPESPSSSVPCSPAAQRRRRRRSTPALAAYIATIRAIDNHAHPMRPVAPGAPADTEFDALPLDGIPPFPIPWRLTPEAPVWAQAARALYGESRAADGAHPRCLRERGERFPEWVLDRAGIDVMLANRIALGPGLAAPRFRWVPFDDALLFPLDTRNEATPHAGHPVALSAGSRPAAAIPARSGARRRSAHPRRLRRDGHPPHPAASAGNRRDRDQVRGRLPAAARLRRPRFDGRRRMSTRATPQAEPRRAPSTRRSSTISFG